MIKRQVYSQLMEEIKKCVVYRNHPRNASHYKINFTVDYQTTGLLAGSILAFTATSISSLKKVMPAFKLAVGTQVKGCLKYKCHKNNRRTYITLTIKFGSGPKKSYSFKTSSLRMSTKLYI